MRQLDDFNRCFNCGAEMNQSPIFCPHCKAPLPISNSIWIRLVRALVGGTLVTLSWSSAAAGVSLLAATDSFGFAAVLLGLGCLVFASLCFAGYQYLKQ